MVSNLFFLFLSLQRQRDRRDVSSDSEEINNYRRSSNIRIPRYPYPNVYPNGFPYPNGYPNLYPNGHPYPYPIDN